MSPSTFFGLELSRRALATQQLALDITGHNIANANTQGYTRQVANMTPTSPYSIPALGRNLSLGTGVTLDTISRARDSFVDRQFRWETAKQEYWAGRQDTLQKVEGLLNEPSENSLHSDMDKFWSAWSELANNPDSRGARAVVRERALALTDSLKYIDQQLLDIKGDLDANIRVKLQQINSYGEQIARLNEKIKQAEVAGDSPNDLRDKRDALADELSKIVPIRITEDKDPNFTDRQVTIYKLSIGNDGSTQRLVDDTSNDSLSIVEVNGEFSSIKWDQAGTELALPTDGLGNLYSNLQMNGYLKDGTGNPIPGYLNELSAKYDTLAKGIADAVNSIHAQGTGLDGSSGINFFVSADGSFSASTLSVNPDILDSLDAIASGKETNASGDLVVGDNSLALAISTLGSGWNEITDAALRSQLRSTLGNSVGDYYGGNIVATIGVDVQEANRMKAGQDVMVDQLTNQRESFSGVSLDEEMTNMIRFQKSYAAAARMVTIMDDLLDTIVNRMGITR